MNCTKIIKTEKSVIVATEFDGRVKKIDWNAVKYNKDRVLKLRVKSKAGSHKLLRVVNLPDSNDVLVFFTGEKAIHYYKWPDGSESPLKRLVGIDSKVLFVNLTKKYLYIFYYASISNAYDLDISEPKIFIDDSNASSQHFRIVSSVGTSKLTKLKGLRYTKFRTSDLVSGVDVINLCTIKIAIKINGIYTYFNIKMPSKRIKKTQFYYVPLASLYINDYAIHVRRTSKASLMLVRRHMEEMEYKFFVRLLESWPVSFLLYYMAIFARKFSKQKVNVYFEKFSCKAEEGAFDVFMRARELGASKNYFIIDGASKDYGKISSINGVILKHSLSSYWMLFRANCLISTEAPGHATFFRSNNRYLRKSIMAASKPFIFLQHGITYLKRQGKKSSFVAGKEAEPSLIVASSKKEARIINRTMKIPKSRILKVGLPIFDSVKFCHIKNSSPGVVTIMYTWKPYEEHLDDFSLSTYYINTVKTFDVVTKYLPRNRVRIIAHPKVDGAMRKTDLADNLWSGAISEALTDTKLLITDYSSVCYNSFYQGSGVVFFQPDLDMYEKETGKLIPGEDEYIGPRCFSYDDLDSLMSAILSHDGINIESLRTREFINNYLSINEFCDGKNVDRLCEELVDRGIL